MERKTIGELMQYIAADTSYKAIVYPIRYWVTKNPVECKGVRYQLEVYTDSTDIECESFLNSLED